LKNCLGEVVDFAAATELSDVRAIDTNSINPSTKDAKAIASIIPKSDPYMPRGKAASAVESNVSV
jgi:glyceraldehyde-3-phosphate dehydrogenase/erythrose-4-phosphate dehydrogenase